MASWDGKLFLKSAHCARESCLSETRFLKKSKQKTSFRRVGCDIRGSSSVLPQNPACIFTDNQKTITRCSGIPQTPTVFPSLSNFCLCCHRDVPPTSKVHNINGIIQFSSSFEGDEPSTCCFTSNKKSCPRMKSGGSTGNDFLVKNLILPRARPPPADNPTRCQSLPHITAIPSHGGSWRFPPNQGVHFHRSEMPRESAAQTNAKFRPPDSSKVNRHKYF